MTNSTRDTDSKQHAEVRGGAASNVSGQANITNTLSVETPKSGKWISIVVPLLAAVLGAYATHKLTLMRAPALTESGAETLLGLSREAIALAQASNASAELVQKLETMSSQAQGVEASARSLRQPVGAASLQADFWLAVGQGAKLPKEATIGVRRVSTASSIGISFNDLSVIISSGEKRAYKAADGSECYVVYMGASPDAKLHGFKTWCSSK
jgi:hypothetical protein